MACETAKEAWDKLKEEFQGSDRTRQMQVLNLRREFEVLRMKESETVKDYTNRLMKVVNQIRLLGEELTERIIVEKVLVSVPKIFESKVSSLEDSEDISQLTLIEVINALQAFEQMRAIRFEGQQAQIAENQEQDEEKLFVATSYATNCSSEAWLINSGCTNHLTYDAGFFKELDRSYTSKVKMAMEIKQIVFFLKLDLESFCKVATNRIVMEMSRCMLFEKDLPKRFWAEMSRGINWIKSQKLGFSWVIAAIQNGYRIYSLKTKKILVSRNVKFDEAVKWNWEKNKVKDALKNHNNGFFSQQQEAA
ncbi:hypothetical protein EZV62_021643 [Acer yangbiense]|uniref:Retroviral polymerase SH3-like domain-containing protein n=1 Tax=Acer yangbiense TaxID=1000413 RepID=A0A5C7H665_9ROSI|nr:hypothetical protein EZV62_021643 [Acer yangbiense]